MFWYLVITDASYVFVLINPIYCDVCVLPSLQPTSDGESRIPPILLRQFHATIVVARDKHTVRVLQQEDDAAHSNENGLQRVVHTAITTFGIVALRTLHRFVCFSIVRAPRTPGKRLLPLSPLLSSLYAIVGVPVC